MEDTTASWSLSSTLFLMGGGVIAGIAVGYALKAATKIALLMLGVMLIAMYSLMHVGYITVNWDAVGTGIEEGSRAAGTWMWAMVKQLSASFVGFAGGVAMGWRLR